MKKHISKITLLIAIFAFTACSEEFLEEPAPAGAVTEEVVFSTRTGVEAYISGIHRRARAQFAATDTEGIGSIYFARDIKGNDLIHNSSWWSFDYAQDNREPTYRRTVFTWEFPYFMINQLNTLINGIEASEALSDEDKEELKGQGLALRAFYYFQLALEFQHTYTYDPSLPAPPIYTELSLEGHPMTTMEEMYNFIISDLTTAIEGLSESRLDKSYINKSVAQGILARVYLTTHNYAGAEEMAHAAWTAYGSTVDAALAPESYNDGFDDMSNPEWMWAAPNYSDQSNYYWLAPHSFTDHDGAYQNIYVNPNFVEEFSDTDVRKLFPRYPDNAGTRTEYHTDKFDFLGFDSDRVLMRTAEMILIEAEALYWQGMEDEALDLLYELQVNRDPNAVKSDNSGEALLEEILLERRKELYSEIGVEWFDAKRLQRGIDRDPIHRLEIDLDPNDRRFFLKIPQTEIDANDAIDPSVNANR